jgi:hypothetical protein
VDFNTFLSGADMVFGTSPARAIFIDLIQGNPMITAEAEIADGGSYNSRSESTLDLGALLAKIPLLLKSCSGTQAANGTLHALTDRDLENASAIIIGRDADPFSEINQDLFAAINLLEKLNTVGSAQVVLRTRSPYSILATPALRQINASSARAAVSFGLEASTKAHAQMVSRSSAAPAERIETMLSFRANGIPVLTQLSPFFGSAQTFDSLERFCVDLLSASDAVLLVEFEQLIQSVPAGHGTRFSAVRTKRQSRSMMIAAEIFKITSPAGKRTPAGRRPRSATIIAA